MRYLPFHLHRMLVAGLTVSCIVAPLYPAQAQAVKTAPELVTLEQDDGSEPQAPAQDAVENGTAAWQGSLMFRQNRVDNLMEIYRVYLEKIAKGQPEEVAPTRNVMDDALKLLTTQDPEEINQEIYGFSLNSILYDDADAWSIWVNGRRYNKKQALEGFTVKGSHIAVTDVTKHQITFTWTPQPRTFPLVLERWENRLRAGKQEDNPQTARDGRVEMDSLGQKVTVTLRPNQTFLSQYMVVMEGAQNLRPVTLDVQANPSLADPLSGAAQSGLIRETPQQDEEDFAPVTSELEDDAASPMVDMPTAPQPQ